MFVNKFRTLLKFFITRFEIIIKVMKEEILKLKSEGKTYKEISEILNCSKSTVSYHCNPKVRQHAIKEAVEYKKRKSKGLPNKTEQDITFNCVRCNKFISKKRGWSKSNKKFCSKECKHKHPKEILTNEWLSGNEYGYTKGGLNPLKGFVRDYIKEKYNYKCSKCGWCEPNPYSNICYLEIHHIDGDSTNTHESNLDLLCPNCHTLTPNYKGLNKNGTRQR